MPLSTNLERSLRAVEESSDDGEFYEVTDRSSSASVIDFGETGDIQSSDDEEADGGEEEELEEVLDLDTQEATVETTSAAAATLTFAALAKKKQREQQQQQQQQQQQHASGKRKRNTESSKPHMDKIQALRERLQEIRDRKLAKSPPSKKSKPNRNRAIHDGDDDDDEGSEDEASNSDAAPRARSSKHAPAVQSSKKAVSRKRKVVDVKKPASRDPRFDKISGPGPDENTLNKRYAFLNEYKASEMAELKAAINKTKNEADKEKLRKKLTSMESQQKARERKEQQQKVIHEHKMKEKELVKEGKTPFYLKKCEWPIKDRPL
jgi:ribosomal RNA-processing protein 36